jgi:predicted dehydrogenase
MTRRTSRRTFLKQTALAGVGFWAAGGVALAAAKGANDKLNVAFAGVGGQGGGNLDNIVKLEENVVALCDIDEGRLGEAADKLKKKKLPEAKTYTDWRKMLEQKDIDAVVVSTPDHNHAIIGVSAMKLGKHLYCEKPLAHSVYECRLMRKVATEQKVATSMGNMGTAHDGLRRAVELIQAGIIGPVTEAHVWTNRPIWPQGIDKRPAKKDPPKGVHWDVWLGPAPERDYGDGYHPFAWRGWWDFGTGALGDMACHTANMAFMALKLGYPTSVEAKTDYPINSETFPNGSTITYQFPKRGDLPEVKWVWYDGKKKIEKEVEKDKKKVKELVDVPNIPEKLLHSLRSSDGSGSLLIGEKGFLFSPSDYGSDYVLGFNDKFTGFQAPEKSLPRSHGHHKDWIEACKGAKPALANFDYAALLTEVVVLGNVALRVGKKIDWNGEEMKATNCPEAAQLVKPEFRKGWEL